MWGTSCGPYLSRPVVLILPWLFGCQEERAGSQAWGSAAVGGCPEPGRWGAWETQRSANNWTGVGLEARGSATLNMTEERWKCLLVCWKHSRHPSILTTSLWSSEKEKRKSDSLLLPLWMSTNVIQIRTRHATSMPGTCRKAAGWCSRNTGKSYIFTCYYGNWCPEANLL